MNQNLVLIVCFNEILGIFPQLLKKLCWRSAVLIWGIITYIMIRIQAAPSPHGGSLSWIYHNPFYWNMCKSLVVFIGGIFLVRTVSDEWDFL
ncbi:Uncharacterized protein BM_BM14717 [Brugia malayi]|uniref:Bm14717, isoform b n=2 Tax=Brugia malayi TaxID=6279 RepID=A0A0J9XTB1_BRUMA|nr:Uncharacterized protein BM_BM14717 [Brugia malayi]CDP94670.1 Bm14717, isoform b [Brugia malayi]VIO86851.1 Uncharacterized protein BM_BM14717 [Brugia malayi]